MKHGECMYSLAFRKRNGQEDFFWKDENYCFEEYSADTGSRYWLADPFLLERDGKVYVFYEMYDLIKRKGKLGYSILNPESKTLTPPHAVLERNYHFSWPYVFEQDGEVYIMPETIEDYRIRIFKAVNFPDDWTEHEILINDIHSCDSLMLEDSGRRYLITSELHHNAPEGKISGCWAKNVIFEFEPDEKFKLKPEGRIISEGDYGIRNAGNVFRYGDFLIRPGQDCVKTYGNGLVFFRIKNIEPYAEEEMFTVNPDNIGTHLKKIGAEEILGIHTYNFSKNFEVIDFWTVKKLPLYIRLIRLGSPIVKPIWELIVKIIRKIIRIITRKP